MTHPPRHIKVEEPKWLLPISRQSKSKSTFEVSQLLFCHLTILN